MQDILISGKTNIIPLGYRGENLSRRVVFSGYDLPEETSVLLHRRSGEKAPYPVTLTFEDGNAVWEITSADTELAGTGNAELQVIDGESILKAYHFKTVVAPALCDPTDTPETAGGNWATQLVASLMESVQEMLDSGTLVSGANGKDGEDGVGIASITQTASSTESGGENSYLITLTDGQTATISVYNGEKGEQGEQGEQGEKGEDGADGKSAYEYAADGGFTGTETEFYTDLAAVGGLADALAAI